MNNAFFEQWLIYAELGNNIQSPRIHVLQHQQQQSEQSGKQVAIGIIGFIIGTVVLLYIVKLVLF
jgi:hypothetical protein